jgi:chloramphenicol-sensitive protein RarD
VNKGILYAITAYAMWGVFPIYFKWLGDVPPLQTTSHRVVWSFLLLALVTTLRREWGALRRAATPRILLIYFTAGALLGVNWLIYVYAVSSGHVVEASLGYFINPLVNVMLGVIFLKERLRPLQWVPVGLAAAGVTYLTLTYGSLPWIALALAFTFGFYGLLKKMYPLGSLPGLTLETALIFLPGLVYLGLAEVSGGGVFWHGGALLSILLALAGLVTVVPLLFFAAAIQRVPLYMMGLIQYIAPTMQLLTGVLLFGEAFTLQRGLGFGCIWLALIVFSLESLWAGKKQAAVSI